MLIANPQGTCVNPREKMTSNGSRARDYGGCCGAWSTATETRTGRKESSSGESEQTPKILWSGITNTQPAYELTITRHGKASPLPNQPDCGINFNQTNTSKLRFERSFPTAASPCSVCLIQRVLTPLPLVNPEECQVSASLIRSLWNRVFLFHSKV